MRPADDLVDLDRNQRTGGDDREPARPRLAQVERDTLGAHQRRIPERRPRQSGLPADGQVRQERQHAFEQARRERQVHGESDAHEEIHGIGTTRRQQDDAENGQRDGLERLERDDPSQQIRAGAHEFLHMTSGCGAIGHRNAPATLVYSAYSIREHSQASRRRAEWTRHVAALDPRRQGRSARRRGYSTASRVWCTVAAGILTEVFYPTIDTPQIRDLQFLVTDGKTFFHDERRNTRSSIDCIDDASLGFEITNVAAEPAYTLRKTVIGHHASGLRVDARARRSTPSRACSTSCRLYVLCAPHLEIGGWGNSAEVFDTKAGRIIVAFKGNTWMALGATSPFLRRSCGYVAVNDGWTDLHDNRRLDWAYARPRTTATSPSPGKSICRAGLSSRSDWRSATRDTVRSRRCSSRW